MMLEGLDSMTYEECLRIAGLFGMRKKRLRGDFKAAYTFFMSVSGEGCANLFSSLTSDTHEVRFHHHQTGY